MNNRPNMAAEEQKNPLRTHVAVKQKDKIRLIALDDIYYFKAENKYIVINTGAAQYLITGTLNHLQEDLDERFIRIHRNALVSTRYLEGLERNNKGRWEILFHNIPDRLEISRRQTSNVRRWLKTGVKH